MNPWCQNAQLAKFCIMVHNFFMMISGFLFLTYKAFKICGLLLSRALFNASNSIQLNKISLVDERGSSAVYHNHM
jgi:hypothetical protein